MPSGLAPGQTINGAICVCRALDALSTRAVRPRRALADVTARRRAASRGARLATSSAHSCNATVHRTTVRVAGARLGRTARSRVLRFRIELEALIARRIENDERDDGEHNA